MFGKKKVKYDPNTAPAAMDAEEAARIAFAADQGLTSHHFVEGEHPIVRIEHLGKTFDGNTQVLRDVNLNVWPGEIVVVLGPSGSGKSTMLRCINLLETPTSGHILIEDEEITGKSISAVNKLRREAGLRVGRDLLRRGGRDAQLRAGVLGGRGPGDGLDDRGERVAREGGLHVRAQEARAGLLHVLAHGADDVARGLAERLLRAAPERGGVRLGLGEGFGGLPLRGGNDAGGLLLGLGYDLGGAGLGLGDAVGLDAVEQGLEFFGHGGFSPLAPAVRERGLKYAAKRGGSPAISARARAASFSL